MRKEKAFRSQVKKLPRRPDKEMSQYETTQTESNININKYKKCIQIIFMNEFMILFILLVMRRTVHKHAKM